MKSKYLAMLAAIASMPPLEPAHKVSTKPLVRHKGNEPKCKTCVHFSKYGSYKCSDPMKMSCASYKRRAKKK